MSYRTVDDPHPSTLKRRALQRILDLVRASLGDSGVNRDEYSAALVMSAGDADELHDALRELDQ